MGSFRFKILVICIIIFVAEVKKNEIKNMDKEKIILKTIMEFEGGDKLHQVPGDAGGLTRYGIAQTANPGVDIANLTLNQAIEIYDKNYWQPLKLDLIKSDSVKWKLFDIAVNMGVPTAAIFLQKSLRVKIDGVIGNETITAANSATEGLILENLEMLQIHKYARICKYNETQYKFLKGWNRRAFSQLKT